MATKLRRKEVKVKAHAFTLAAVVWLFFVPFGLFGVLQKETVSVLVGIGILLVEALFVWSAIQCFRKEKKREVIWIGTSTHVGAAGASVDADAGDGGDGGGDGGD